MQPIGLRKQFTAIADALAFAQGIVDTVREPVLVLDRELRVIAANRSFYSVFKVSAEDTQGRPLYALGNGQWDIPQLRLLLEEILPGKGVMEGYEVEHAFPGLGPRTMCLNARQLNYEGGADTTILLGIEDVTERRVLEQEKDELLRQKDVLLEELQHRIANSLQIIASIILLKARAVQSEETRLHLHDAHKRVMSIAAVQRQLHASGATGPIQIAPYLTGLCEALATSMIGDNRPISLQVVGDGGSATSRQAESLGLIVTELVMNALKHAFPDDNVRGQITVAYDTAGTNWKLSVSDNGLGKPDGGFAQGKSGLGTGIVKALAQQLDAQVVTLAGPKGTTVNSGANVAPSNTRTSPPPTPAPVMTSVIPSPLTSPAATLTPPVTAGPNGRPAKTALPSVACSTRTVPEPAPAPTTTTGPFAPIGAESSWAAAGHGSASSRTARACRAALPSGRRE